MSFPLVALGDVANFVRGVTYKPTDLVENFSDGSVVCMRTANVQNDLDESDLLSIPRSFVKNDEKILREGDLLVSTANSWNLVGKCCWVPELKYESAIGGFIAALRSNAKIDPRYLYRWFTTPETQANARNCGRQTTNISNMDLGRCLKLKIPLPSLPEQRRIATILDKADALRAQRRAAIAKLDELLQSVFIEMFGDPVMNPKGWVIGSLSAYGSFKNGLNFGKDESGVNIRYVGVGDFKSKAALKDFGKLAFVELNRLPAEDYFLHDGDLLFVRSNGNRELVGRCMAVYPGMEKVTYSGFCIRYRIADVSLRSTYVAHLFRSVPFRRLIFQGGQGANIQNINQQILSDLPIPIPDVGLQRQFATIVEKIEAQKHTMQRAAEMSNTFFASLQQHAFSGKL